MIAKKTKILALDSKASNENDNLPPLVSALKSSAETNAASFHFPGHNRGRAAPSSMTQLIGIKPFLHDFLFSPEGPILEAQKLASELFGASETWFLVGGTTCGIQAAIMATCSPGSTLILPRNSHISTVSALVLSGALPKYIIPEYDSDWDIPGGITVSQFAAHTRNSLGLGVKVNPRTSLRSPWRSVAGIWEQFAAHTRIYVGKGDKLKFWQDVWAGETSLASRFPRLFHLAVDQEAMVSEVLGWNERGEMEWKINFRRDLRSRNYSDYGLCMQVIGDVEINRYQDDKRVWTGAEDGVFSTKSFFDILTKPEEASRFKQSRAIWKGFVPTKIKIFSWLASLQKLNTNDIMQRKSPGAAISPQWCILCKESCEGGNHLLLHCRFSTGLWSRLLQIFSLQGPLPESWSEFIIIKWNPGGNGSIKTKLWLSFVHAIGWRLWLERNKRIFQDRSSTTIDIWYQVCASVGLWAKSHKMFNNVENFLMCLDPMAFLSSVDL